MDIATSVISCLTALFGALVAIFGFKSQTYSFTELKKQKELCETIEKQISDELDKPDCNYDYAVRLHDRLRREQEQLKYISARVPEFKTGN